MINILLFIAILLGSCSIYNTTSTPKLYLLVDTIGRSADLRSDYEYHLGGLIEYYSSKEVDAKLIYNTSIIIESNKGKIDVRLDKDETFAMILIDKSGNLKIDKNFGTDVDLMLFANEYFKLKD